MIKGFEDATKKVYAVILEDEPAFLVDVWWSINLPNNPSFDEILEEYVLENHGDAPYTYFCLDDLSKYETGALKYLYPEME